MKQKICTIGIVMCLALLFSFQAFATDNSIIDVSTASEGYFTVRYDSSADSAMKVGVSIDGNTIYHNYTSGSEGTFAFTNGNGNYTITLYSHLYGTSYRPVTSTSVQVYLTDDLVKYRVSTSEITFSADDAVGIKTAEICEGLASDEEKIIAIHNYIASNFKYNRTLASDVRSGKITTYTPNTNEILNTKLGVCYDFSALFAAMCRSQGIACAMAKGYYMNGGYHAWNMVNLDGDWIAVDLTLSVLYRRMNAKELTDCTVSLKSYYGYTY